MKRTASEPGLNYRGPAEGWTRVIKCRRFLSFFNVTLLGIYRWLKYIAGSLKSYPPFWKARGREDSQEKDYSFLGNDTFPNLYDALVYERKFKSEYLERQIYERSLKSEPSIVKFIENQSEHLSKFVFKKISTIDIPKSSKLHRYVNKVRKLHHARYKCNNKCDPKIINLNCYGPSSYSYSGH